MDSLFKEILVYLYGEPAGLEALERLERLLARRPPEPPATATPISQRDVLLITYPDMVQETGRPPLRVLHEFLDRHARDVVTAVHLLPFFPSSSDDGFSVVDYTEVDPAYGDWADVSRFSGTHRLMVDAVLNHVSARSAWVQGYCRGEEPYRDFLLAPDPQADWSRVIRPRATPLFTAFDTDRGPVSLWTTFSGDQVDLNYANPDVLLAMIGILLDYLGRGAQWIRLDAVGYLWKEAGSTCLHLPQTHRVVRLLRAVLDRVAPWARLITETNVPHVDNVAYFGAGDEAHMVYQFSLAPLVVHALLTRESTALTAWASGLTPPPPNAAYLNFLASHDGIGLTPTRGLLPDEAIYLLVESTRACGGGVSCRSTQGGGLQPYELNVNLLDLLSGGGENDSDDGGRRFLLAHAILLAFSGIPAVYFHSLFGSRGDPQSVERTGHLRSVNRQKLQVDSLETDLAASGLRRRLFSGMKSLISTRRSLPSLDPSASQEILDLGPQVFALRRTSRDGEELVCLAEVSDRSARLGLGAPGARGLDRLTGETVDLSDIEIAPLGYRWITTRPEPG